MERLKEVKAGAKATINDIPVALKVFTELINTNKEAQKIVKGVDIIAQFKVEGADPYILVVKGGKSSFEKKGASNASFTLATNLKTITEVLLGDIDAAVAFLKGDIDVEGDFEKMVVLFEIIELANDVLQLINKEKRKILIDAKTMKKLYNVYKASLVSGANIDPADVPLIFNIFTTFANLNQEAQETIKGEEILVQMIIKDVGTYVVKISEGKSTWSDKAVDEPTLQFEIGLNTAADIFLSGDAASAFLAGKINASGNIAQAIVLQDLIDIFLLMLPFTQKK